MMNLLFALLCFLTATTSPAGSLTAELDRNRVELGEAAQLSIAVSGSLKDDLELPAVEGLTFQQIGTSTNVQIVNGSFSKETIYNFAVTSDRAGTFQIPSIKASIDKEEAATPPLTLTFMDAGSGGAQVAPRPPTQDGEEASKQASGDLPFIFIERELASRQMYEGEAVLATLRVFHRVRLAGLVPERDPAPDWRVISKDGQKNYETIRDGVQWRVIEIQEVLIPLKAGSLQLPAYALRATYLQPAKQRMRRGSIWDLFQGGLMDMGQEVTKRINVALTNITVKALPTEGRPAHVADMVGDFKLTAEVSKRELNPGETSTVTVKVTGRGALDRMTEIKLPPLVGARVYPDKPQLKENIDDQGLKSSRELKFAVVPSQAGTLDLGSIELGVFEPRSGTWQTLKQPLGTLVVSGAAVANQVLPPDTAPAVADNTNHNQKSSPSTSPAPLALTPETNVGSQQNNTTGRWFAFAIFLLGLVGVAIFAKPIWRKYQSLGARQNHKKPFAALANKTGLLPLEEALKELRCLVAKGDQDPKALTIRDIVDATRSKGVSDDVAGRLESALQVVEASAYRDAPLDEKATQELRAVLLQLSQWEIKA